MERIFAKSTLRQFWERRPDSKYLKTWYDTTMNSDWKTPNEVKKNYANASILKDSRVVFRVKGDSYILAAKLSFEKQWAFIRFIGTHAQHNQIDANSI